MACELGHYETRDGRVPMEEFLLALPPKLRAKVMSDEAIIAREGPHLREPYTKPLGDGLFELRGRFSNGVARSLFFFHARGRIVVTHGFAKKSRRTPPGEIERANRYRADWIRRTGDEQL